MNQNPQSELWMKLLPGNGEGGYMAGLYTTNDQIIDIRCNHSGCYWLQYKYGPIYKISAENYHKIPKALKTGTPTDIIETMILKMELTAVEAKGEA